MTAKGTWRNRLSPFFMWEFWLNYAIILPILLPIPVIKMQYVVQLDGKDVPQEAQSRTVLECYQYFMVEGMANPWNIGVIVLHWLLPLLIMFVVWSFIVRRKNTSDEDDSNTFSNIVDDIQDLIDR